MNTMETLAWRRLDEPGMEVAHVASFSEARGVQIGRGYELRWILSGDILDLELNGAERLRVELGGSDFFDVFASPFFNSLPVMRDGLLEGGPPRDYAMRFVGVPDLSVVTSEQRYTPLDDRRVRFSSGDYEADITFDECGFVILYEGFLERL
jgi:hypothetical protein